MNIDGQQVDKAVETSYKKGGIQRDIELCQKKLINDPTNVKLHVRLGDLYLQWHLDINQARQYIDEAINEYQLALESSIDEAEVYCKLAFAFYHKKDLDKSINYYNMAIELQTKNPEAHFMVAKCLTIQGKFQEAYLYCETAVKQAPLSSTRARFLLCKLNRILKPHNLKEWFYNFVLILIGVFLFAFDKGAVKGLFKTLSYIRFVPMLLKGIIQAQVNGLSQAIETYQEALEKAPGFVFLYCLLGDVYRVLTRYEDAVCEYKMAIWLDPLNVTAYRLLCVTYEEQGDYDNAVSIYEKLIEIQPYIAEYHSNLANILYLKGDAEAAVSHYQHAITLNPSLTWTSIVAQTLGYVQQEVVKNHDAAIAAYQTAYLLTPKDTDIYVNLGSAFYEKGDYENALSVYRKALMLEPYNAKIHCNLGYLYWGQGELDEAIKAYELAIKYDNTYDIAYNNIGVIYLDDLGRIKQAIEYFSEAIKYNPNYALAHYNLARSLAICGDKVEAAKLYQVAQDINTVTSEMDPAEIQFKIKELFES